MFEGNMLRGLTGTPMRKIARANSVFAEADPEPFTLANLTTKSLTASSFIETLRLAPRVESSLSVTRPAQAGHGRGADRAGGPRLPYGLRRLLDQAETVDEIAHAARLVPQRLGRRRHLPYQRGGVLCRAVHLRDGLVPLGDAVTLLR